MWNACNYQRITDIFLRFYGIYKSANEQVLALTRESNVLPMHYKEIIQMYNLNDFVVKNKNFCHSTFGLFLKKEPKYVIIDLDKEEEE